MNAQEAISMGRRPIRELVFPDVEEPVTRGDVHAERRQSLRFARRLPALMTVAGTEHRITCVDIGYGGIGVLAPDKLQVAEGDRAAVKIRLGARSFWDEFTVVGTESAVDGTTLHLSL